MQHVIVLRGASASSREREENIPAVVKDIIRQTIGFDDLFFDVARSKREILRLLKLDRRLGVKRIGIFGKSWGGAQAIKAVKSYGRKVSQFDTFCLCTVDPHNWWIGDRRDAKLPRRMPICFRAWNVFQKNRYPRGAYVHRAENEYLHDPGIDHFNITTSDQAKDVIEKAIQYMNTGEA